MMPIMNATLPIPADLRGLDDLQLLTMRVDSLSRVLEAVLEHSLNNDALPWEIHAEVARAGSLHHLIAEEQTARRGMDGLLSREDQAMYAEAQRLEEAEKRRKRLLKSGPPNVETESDAPGIDFNKPADPA